jgi:lipid-A-disaccharide synthase-like uncharacterized protein
MSDNKNPAAVPAMRTGKVDALFLPQLLFRPGATFEKLATFRPDPVDVFWKSIVWLAVLPPLFAYYGGRLFGWRLGAQHPLDIPDYELKAISAVYFFILVFGYVSTAFVSRWMASTYGARSSLGIHFALVSFVGAPLALASFMHLYPDVFVNAIVLVLALLWSAYLLFRGVPVALRVDAPHGMLMASSIIAWLMVGFVSMLGLTVVLWQRGIGPSIWA